MKMLISSEQFVSRQSTDMIPLECEICHKTFHKVKHHIQTILKSCMGKGKYCSEKCKGLARQKRLTKQCDYCQTPIVIKPYRLKFSHQFCSRSCRAKHWNANKTWGGPRSKLELWIESELTKKYPSLKIEYNDTSAIGSELDIYIPSLKTAFELNGIFHYEPIFGNKKLNETKNSDQRKFSNCATNGIGLCIIDTHNAKYLKAERDQKFLDIITNIIEPLLENK